MSKAIEAAIAIAGFSAFASMAYAAPVEVNLENYPLVETHRQMAITQDNARGANTLPKVWFGAPSCVYICPVQQSLMEVGRYRKLKS